MTQVSLHNIALAYNGQHVLHDINLSIAPGEFCVFIGPSGCGKSSLLRLIAGLEPVSSGTLSIDGQTINDVAPAERNIAMVFQSYALYPHMTVYDNMAFGLTRQRLDKAEIKRRVADASRILQLDTLLERKPGALSGGQRQRVAIGRAIVKKPKVFLFDEPLSNLDASLRAQTRLEIARLHRDLNSASMIYVTHDQVEAMTLADKIVLLRPAAEAPGQSNVAQIGTPLELYHHPANVFAAGFIGTPAMNFLDASLIAVEPQGITVMLQGRACAAAVDGSDLAPGAALTLGIRPEHLVLGQGAWQAKIVHVEALGEHSYVHLQWPGVSSMLVAKTQNESLRAGQTVAFSLPANALHVFRGDGRALRRLLSDFSH
ncbi:sn-glycerol-3-phosphate ABC transporter ATP-binding protein UgpC [Duganella sp. FT92W]|uniref:sn-glycerol-3-phosphate ABC transporter ATP-binding protein UgpC n=1 Tax=Pseudoduganella rivuli TaxID=2666085 RepID=A0A7X2LWH4_9BURK|nr:sn-glycerol-3-phosphate ABC transporter ATP-binding protein UgpC [Pseudoduganella rivuli]MRV74909.1 sn-glycerol-3-phosphate ABC transporter ATP-binding protein UgpC [Pseudoduganella rivuli]